MPRRGRYETLHTLTLNVSCNLGTTTALHKHPQSPSERRAGRCPSARSKRTAGAVQRPVETPGGGTGPHAVASLHRLTGGCTVARPAWQQADTGHAGFTLVPGLPRSQRDQR